MSWVKKAKELERCPRCGKMKDDVRTIIDPYIYEMTGDKEQATMCGDCEMDAVQSV